MFINNGKFVPTQKQKATGEIQLTALTLILFMVTSRVIKVVSDWLALSRWQRPTQFRQVPINEKLASIFHTGKCWYSAFKENFRPLHQHNPKALRSIKDQVGQQLESNICDEMTHMFEEENIISLMNSLDGFKEYPGVAWRPIGNPPVDVRSHVLPAQEKHRDQLVAILKELESRNRMLQETVRSRQQKLFATREKIDEELSVWQKTEEAVPTEAINSIKDSVESLSQS